MKYLAFWEYDPEDLEKARVKWMKFGEVAEKKPELFPKSISKSYAMFEGHSGFQLFEADDPKQLVAMMMYYTPEAEFRFIPIVELKEASEVIEKLK
jgi:hypothetical protein